KNVIDPAPDMSDAFTDKVQEVFGRAGGSEIELLDGLRRTEDRRNGFVPDLKAHQASMDVVGLKEEAVFDFQNTRVFFDQRDFEVNGRVRPVVIDLARVIDGFDFSG